jgi:hypothetical protein
MRSAFWMRLASPSTGLHGLDAQIAIRPVFRRNGDHHRAAGLQHVAILRKPLGVSANGNVRSLRAITIHLMTDMRRKVVIRD